MDIEDPEVSFERYHDRYMATLRGQYEAGRMGGEARALRKLKEQSEAIQEKDRILAEKDREIEENNPTCTDEIGLFSKYSPYFYPSS